MFGRVSTLFPPCFHHVSTMFSTGGSFGEPTCLVSGHDPGGWTPAAAIGCLGSPKNVVSKKKQKKPVENGKPIKTKKQKNKYFEQKNIWWFFFNLNIFGLCNFLPLFWSKRDDSICSLPIGSKFHELEGDFQPELLPAARSTAWIGKRKPWNRAWPRMAWVEPATTLLVAGPAQADKEKEDLIENFLYTKAAWETNEKCHMVRSPVEPSSPVENWRRTSFQVVLQHPKVKSWPLFTGLPGQAPNCMHQFSCLLSGAWTGGAAVSNAKFAFTKGGSFFFFLPQNRYSTLITKTMCYSQVGQIWNESTRWLNFETPTIRPSPNLAADLVVLIMFHDVFICICHPKTKGIVGHHFVLALSSASGGGWA